MFIIFKINAPKCATIKFWKLNIQTATPCPSLSSPTPHFFCPTRKNRPQQTPEARPGTPSRRRRVAAATAVPIPKRLKLKLAPVSCRWNLSIPGRPPHDKGLRVHTTAKRKARSSAPDYALIRPSRPWRPTTPWRYVGCCVGVWCWTEVHRMRCQCARFKVGLNLYLESRGGENCDCSDCTRRWYRIGRMKTWKIIRYVHKCYLEELW